MALRTCLVHIIILISCVDSLQFDNTVSGKQIWANNSQAAPFKWRYSLDGNDVSDPAQTFNCGYLEGLSLIPVITKFGEDSPTVLGGNRLSGRVQTYVNSENNKEFGFIITQARKTDPKQYICNVAYVYRRGGREVTLAANSQILTLEVLDPPDLRNCLNNVQSVRYDRTLQVKCIATGNPSPRVKCDLLDRKDKVIKTTGFQIQNITRDFNQEAILLPLKKIVCFVTAERTGSYNKTEEVTILRAPYKPQNLTQVYPAGALETSIYLQWTPIPRDDQGGELSSYEVVYWHVGQTRTLNQTRKNIGLPPIRDGFITYELKDLSTGVQYNIAVYGRNQYGSDDTWQEKKITATPNVGPQDPKKSTGDKTGAIIGGVIGGVVFFIIVIVIFVYFTRRSDKNKRFPTSYVEDAVDYPPNQGASLYSSVEKKHRKPSQDNDSTSGYPDVVTTTQNGDYNRNKSFSSYEPSSKVYL